MKYSHSSVGSFPESIWPLISWTTASLDDASCSVSCRYVLFLSLGCCSVTCSIYVSLFITAGPRFLSHFSMIMSLFYQRWFRTLKWCFYKFVAQGQEWWGLLSFLRFDSNVFNISFVLSDALSGFNVNLIFIYFCTFIFLAHPRKSILVLRIF